MVLFGIVSVCVGVYELVKKTVVGRNVSASTPEEIKKFSKVDATTYLVEGVLVICLGFDKYLPFMNNSIAPIVIFIAIVIMVIYNYRMAKKMLSR